MSAFRPHDVVWTRDKASRFWQYMVAKPSEEATYFSHVVGAHVIAETRAHGIPLSGRVLDYGCGPGHLLKHLIAEGVPCEGADFDRVSLDQTRERVGTSPLFNGVTLIDALPSQLPANAFDAVFLIETLEHLIGEELTATLTELRRILRPGGHLIVTTPNEEELEAHQKMCPDCGCVFHIVQHVTRWDRCSLAAVIRTAGLEPVATKELKFRRSSKLNWVKRVADQVFDRHPPNLMMIGRKP